MLSHRLRRAAAGANNVKIYVTTADYTNPTYGAPVTDGVLIFDSIFPEHVAANVADDQILTLI